jgi:hypothetical protein
VMAETACWCRMGCAEQAALWMSGLHASVDTVLVLRSGRVAQVAIEFYAMPTE